MAGAGHKQETTNVFFAIGTIVVKVPSAETISGCFVMETEPETWATY